MNFFTRLFAKPVARRIVTRGELLDRVATQMEAAGVELQAWGKFFIADQSYVGVTPREAAQAVRDSAALYVPETNDCDEAALMAKAEIIGWQREGHFGNWPAAFGELHLDTHALNAYLDLTGTLRLIDNDGAEHPLTWLQTRPVRLLKF